MLLAAKSKQEVATECQDMGCNSSRLITVIAALNQFKKYQAVMDNKGYLSRCYAMDAKRQKRSPTTPLVK